jgi:hypothetical protein
MSKITTAVTYEQDLEEASQSMRQLLIEGAEEECDGNGKKAINDALNDAWADGIAIDAWVAKAAAYIPDGLIRSAE